MPLVERARRKRSSSKRECSALLVECVYFAFFFFSSDVVASPSHTTTVSLLVLSRSGVEACCLCVVATAKCVRVCWWIKGHLGARCKAAVWKECGATLAGAFLLQWEVNLKNLVKGNSCLEGEFLNWFLKEFKYFVWKRKERKRKYTKPSVSKGHFMEKL